MAIVRACENPIIRPEQIRPSREDFEVIGVFNAGVARHGDEVILLLRVAERPVACPPGSVLCPVYDPVGGRTTTIAFATDDAESDLSDPRLIVRPDGTYLTSISHLRLARSADGIRFQIDESPWLAPANEDETFGIEDPRITQMGETYYIDYVAVSPRGVSTCLATTRDFETVERRGVIFHPDNKDVVIFPDRVDGRHYALHRPHSSLFQRNNMWIAESPDLLCWGNHRTLMGTRPGMWDETRIGASAVPFRLPQGWLEIYHGANRDNRYCMGALLLEGMRPWRIVARSDEPLFEPEAEYERGGFFDNVVFSCGLLFEDERLKIYYGAADTSICYAEIPLADVYRNLSV